jgi:hypothetical protein
MPSLLLNFRNTYTQRLMFSNDARFKRYLEIPALPLSIPLNMSTSEFHRAYADAD